MVDLLEIEKWYKDIQVVTACQANRLPGPYTPYYDLEPKIEFIIVDYIDLVRWK